MVPGHLGGLVKQKGVLAGFRVSGFIGFRAAFGPLLESTLRSKTDKWSVCSTV